MSTYINQTVQITRRILALEAQIQHTADRRARTVLSRDLTAAGDARQAVILTAIRAGVDADLLRWAIDAQTPERRAAVDELIERMVDELPAEEALAA